MKNNSNQSKALTLANELGEAGYSPRQIATTAAVTMENHSAACTMTQIHLDVIATVPRVAQCDFVDAALRAKANCPIARALNANISMRAKLSPEARPHGLYPARQKSERTGQGPTAPRIKRGLFEAGRFLRLIS